MATAPADNDDEVLSHQRRALAPIERIVAELAEAMGSGGADQHAAGAGPEQLRLLHSVLRELATADEAVQTFSLPQAAEAVGERLFCLLEALNAAVQRERQEQGLLDVPGAGTVPMPILGLYALEKAVELTHSLSFFPRFSPSVRRAVPFAAALSPKDSGGSSGAPPIDSTPYGEIIVLTRAAEAATAAAAAATAAVPSRGPSDGLFRSAERSVGLLVSLTEELHPAFHSVRHVATVYAALLELCYHPEARATPTGAAHASSCRELWAALTKALPTQLRTDALLALQAASAAPSSAPDASVSAQRQAGVGKAPSWFVRAVRFQLSVTIAGEKGVSSMLSAVLGTDHADDDRAVSAVARLVGDYSAHRALLGEHVRRYFLAMGRQLMPLLVAGLDGDDSTASSIDGGAGADLPSVAHPAPGPGGGGSEAQADTVAAMRTGSAEAWRKAAAKVAAAALRSAPTELGFEALSAQSLSPSHHIMSHHIMSHQTRIRTLTVAVGCLRLCSRAVPQSTSAGASSSKNTQR
eukprot:COSAG06_NODE_169_length_21469_cov_23.096865_2_plen_524_part_00